VPLPALGKKGGGVTADSPCSCTAESRDCRARSSLHVGDRYPIESSLDGHDSCYPGQLSIPAFKPFFFLEAPVELFLPLLFVLRERERERREGLVYS
jgi:hypothetical protein